MNLVERLTSVLRKSKKIPTQPVEETKPESLVAIVVPRKVLTEHDYKKRGIVDAGEIGKYFHGCALDIHRDLNNVYGDFLEVSKKDSDRNVEYVFRKRNQAVTYSIIGINGFESSDGQRFSTEVTGLIMIQQPVLDFQKAGSFIKAIMGSHLLDYRKETDTKFGIFYYHHNGKMNESESEQRVQGIPILKQMGVKPTEAAEYFQVMYFGGYRHKVFQQGELEW